MDHLVSGAEKTGYPYGERNEVGFLAHTIHKS